MAEGGSRPTGNQKSWRICHLAVFQHSCCARGLDVIFFACETTMGVMNVAESDLIEGCDISGAAAFLDYAADADVHLFV